MFIREDQLQMPLRGRIAAVFRRAVTRCGPADAIPTARFAVRRFRPALVGMLFAAGTLAGTLAGCADGVGALMVDPGRYEGYACKDLVNQWNGLIAREKQLRGLIDKADESTSGVVIGALAYRGDYQTVLEQKKVLQRTAAEKNCQLTPPSPSFSSDKMIH